MKRINQFGRKRRVDATPPAWLKSGARVDYRSILSGPVTHPNALVLTEPWQLGGGEWVVRIEGVSGGVWVGALTRAAGGAA